MFGNAGSLPFKGEEPYSHTNFSPRDYLATYYPPLPQGAAEEYCSQERAVLKTVMEENLSLLQFYATRVRSAVMNLPHPIQMLEIGGGPVVHPLISLVPSVDSVCFTDYLSCNLDVVSEWAGDRHNKQWRSYVQAALYFENEETPTEGSVNRREWLVRLKLSRLCRYDALTDKGLVVGPGQGQFSFVSSSFCLESITGKYEVWQEGLRNISRHLSCGGLLAMTALRGAKEFLVGTNRFPAVPLRAENLERELSTLEYTDIRISEKDCLSGNGYDGMLYIVAYKGPEGAEDAR